MICWKLHLGLSHDKFTKIEMRLRIDFIAHADEHYYLPGSITCRHRWYGSKKAKLLNLRKFKYMQICPYLYSKM